MVGAAKFAFQKSGFISHQISWSALIMFNIRKINDSILRKLIVGRTD